MYRILDFNWVWTLSSANINFYELTRARSASLLPQTETKRSYRHLNCFLPLALSVNRHLGASESLNLLAVLQCVTDSLDYAVHGLFFRVKNGRVNY
jgi:hypothetical protein